MPYLPLFLQARGLPASRIGLLLGCLEIAGMIGPLLIGRMADKLAAYRVLLAACFIVPIAAFIPMEMTLLFPVYLACVIAMGFTWRAAIPLLDSLMSRVLPDPARQYGRLRVAGSVGFIAISLLLYVTGWVSGGSSLAILLAFVSAAACAALVVGFLPSPPKNPLGGEGGNSGDTARVVTTQAVTTQAVTTQAAAARPFEGFDLKFWAVIGVVFLGRFGMGAYYSFFSLYLKQTFPAASVSLLWAIGPLAEIVTIWFSGPLIRRWGIRTLLIVSLAAISARLGFFIVAPSIAAVALAQLLHALAFGTFHTTAIAYVNGKVAHEKRGMGMAIYGAVGNGLPSFLASVAGGYLLQCRGFVTLFLTYAVVPLLGIVVLTAFGSKLLPRHARTARR